MKWPFRRSKKDNYVYTWESEPFAFQKGAVYVIEVDITLIELAEAQRLSEFFVKQGVIVKLVFTSNGKALNPIKVKRKKEQV